MLVTVFILGLPGSGKSTVVRWIEAYLRDLKWSVRHLNDYMILREMFLEDREKGEARRFRPADHDGFDVLDFAMFDEALQILEERVKKASQESAENQIVLVEFARNDYQKAFEQFHSFLRPNLSSAFFIYLDARIDVCVERVKDRVRYKCCNDDYYVSEYIFEAYYCEHQSSQLPDILARYGVDVQQRVRVIDNNASTQEKSGEILACLDEFIALA